MKKYILSLLLGAMAVMPLCAQTGTVTVIKLSALPPSTTSITDANFFPIEQSGTVYRILMPPVKAYVLNSMSTGLTVTGTTVTVAYGTTAGTALQGNALGTTVQGYSAVLTTLGGTINPFTAGSGVTMTGTWPNITLSAPTSSYSFGTGLNNSGGAITVVYGTSAGTALQGNSIGTSVQGYNANLQSISNGTWTGTTTITTLGTVNSGTWNAGIIGVSYGGTGTATPSLVAGSNIAITGSWPNQTINASTQPWEFKNASFTGAMGHKYQVSTASGTVVMTLSGTTDMGSIEVQDVALSFATHNFFVTATGSITINGTITTYTDAVIGDKLNCTYSGTLGTWSIK